MVNGYASSIIPGIALEPRPHVVKSRVAQITEDISGRRAKFEMLDQVAVASSRQAIGDQRRSLRSML